MIKTKFLFIKIYGGKKMYRTKTYIAAGWSEESEVIEKLYEWNNNRYLSLNFTDAHEVTKARDSSLNCTIKDSLRTRLNVSKTFVLIVGDNTKDLRSGSCAYCASYNSWNKSCARGRCVNYDSYIDYECKAAIKDDMNIVVLYNSTVVDKSKCPNIISSYGTHIPVYYYENGIKKWNYQKIKWAIE